MKLFFKELKKNIVLTYILVVTLLLILFYSTVLIVLGPVDALPAPGEIPDLRGITFLLMISYNFFLLIIFILSFIKKFYENLKRSHSLLKLLVIHGISFILALFVPIFIFIGAYIVSYFLWYSISVIFLLLFARKISVRAIGNQILKSKKLSIISYLAFWLIGLILFGVLYASFDWTLFSFNQLIILMAFPILILIVPILGLVIKPKSGNQAPLTLFALIIFFLSFYNWIRYLNWDHNSSSMTIIDMIIDMTVILYSFFSLFKNAQIFSKMVKQKIQIDQFLMLFIWTKISSTILLLTSVDYQIYGISASEGTFLATILLLFLLSIVLAILWEKKGLTKEEMQTKITLPDIAADQIN